MSFQTEIVEKIILPPHNLNNDLGEHILDILKKKYLNHCTKQGYIIKIIKILKRSNGEASILDFEGNTSFIVRFLAEVSKPKELITNEMCDVEKGDIRNKGNKKRQNCY